MKTYYKLFLLSAITVITISSCAEDALETIEEELAEEVTLEEEIDPVPEDDQEEVVDNSIAYFEPHFRATRDKFMDGVQDEANGNINSLTRLDGMDYKVTAKVELRGKDYLFEGVFNLISEEIVISVNGEEPYYRPNISITNCTDCEGAVQVSITVKDDISGYFSRSFYLDFQSDF